MAKTFRPYEPDQQLLLPPSVQDWVPEGHLARFISDMVDSMDLSEIEGAYTEERGYPPYHPCMMLKLLLFGYCTGTYSSRKMAAKLQDSVAFRFLAAGNEPDFRTISDFRNFTTDRDGDFEIYRMDDDGSDQANVTEFSTADDTAPELCVDGLRLVFVSDRDDSSGDVFIMDVDGTDQTNLTPDTAGDVDKDPDCGLPSSSSGPTIVFATNRDGNYEIYRMGIDGSDLTRLTNNSIADGEPTWCGSNIVFTKDGDLWLMGEWGEDERELSCSLPPESQPSCHPSGNIVAYSKYLPSSSNEIFRLNICSSGCPCVGEVRLTTNTVPDFQPSWSPGGRYIAFGRLVSSDYEIYRMDAEDGSSQVVLTDNDDTDNIPSWGEVREED